METTERIKSTAIETGQRAGDIAGIIGATTIEATKTAMARIHEMTPSIAQQSRRAKMAEMVRNHRILTGMAGLGVVAGTGIAFREKISSAAKGLRTRAIDIRKGMTPELRDKAGVEGQTGNARLPFEQAGDQARQPAPGQPVTSGGLATPRPDTRPPQI